LFAAASLAFVTLERHLLHSERYPLFDLRILRMPRVAPGVIAVLLGMSCYSGFLVSLTLYLQTGLGFSPIHAGLIFAVYASGFVVASLTWTRASPATQKRLPFLGPLAMAAALLAVGLSTGRGGWPLALTTPLMFAGGLGHACGFSPLANRLTTLVKSSQAGNLSGLILTADFAGTALGPATFVGLYLSTSGGGSAYALLITTGAIAVTLIVTAVCSKKALAPVSPAGLVAGQANRAT
jgi:predicted MFS family arabinose efflux permease